MLPTTRERTYVLGMPLPPDDLNAIQDAIIAGKHSTLTLLLTPNGNGGAPLSTSVWNGGAGGRVDGTNLSWTVTIPLRAGDRIKEIRARVKDSATGPTLLRMNFTRSIDGSVDAVIANVTTSGAGTVQTLQLAGLSEVVVSGKAYSIEFEPPANNGGNLQIYSIEVDYDHL